MVQDTANDITARDEARIIIERIKRGKVKLLLSTICFLVIGCAYLYLRTPKYEINASITLYEESTTPTSLVRQFSIGNILGGSGSVFNEMQFLSSHTTMMRAVERLGLNTTYLTKKGFLKKEITFPTPVIKMTAAEGIADTLTKTLLFTVDGNSNGDVRIKARTGGNSLGTFEGRLPKLVETEYGNFLFEYSDSTAPRAVMETVKFCGLSKAAEEYLRDVTFNIPVKLADVVELTYRGQNKDLGIALLNTLIEEYNLRSMEDTKKKATERLGFIDDRILSLTGELSASESEIKDFKERNNMTDIGMEVQFQVEKKAMLEKEILKQRAETEILSHALNFILVPDNRYSLVPSIVVGNDEEEGNVVKYNDMLLRRSQLLRSAKPGNESLKEIDQQLDMLRQNVVTTLTRLKNNSEMILAELNANLAKVNSTMGRVPSQENIFRDIYRDQKLKEQLYIFLLEQREETAMNILTTTGRGKIVTAPYVDTIHEPRSGVVILLMFFIGGVFFFPAVWYIGLLINRR